jgi:AbiV family abortive infection protein
MQASDANFRACINTTDTQPERRPTSSRRVVFCVCHDPLSLSGEVLKKLANVHRIGDMKPMTILQLKALQDAVLENAKSLIADAEFLAENIRHERAFSLGVLACEELAKSPILSQAYLELAIGEPVDWHALGRFMRTHDQKLTLMALLDFITAVQSRHMRTLFMQHRGGKIVRRRPKEINIAKQDGFYVDVNDDGTPKRPSETIRPKDVFEVLQLAHKAYEMLSEAVVDGRAFMAREGPEGIRRFRKDLRPLAELIRQLVDN